MIGELFTQIALGLIMILGAVFTYVLVPWIRAKLSADQLAKLITLVNIAVNAAEQFFRAKEITGVEKKKYALEYLRTLGVDVETKQLDALIEAAVYQMNLKQKDKIPDLIQSNFSVGTFYPVPTIESQNSDPDPIIENQDTDQDQK